MQPTESSKQLTSYLTKHLCHERGASSNTNYIIQDTFVLLITFMEFIGIKLTKLTIEKITRDAIFDFLE